MNMPRRASALLLLAIALGLGLAACGGLDEEGVPVALSWPEVRLVAEEAVICTPGRRWSVGEDGVWRFRTLGRVFCGVTATPAAPLVLRLEPAGSTAHYRYRIAWDGEELTDEPVGLERFADGLTVPAERLTPGRHELRLSRVYTRQDRRFDNPADNELATVAYGVGAAETTFDPARRGDYELLADFLELGLAGLGKERHAGALLVGEASTTLEVEASRPVTARFPVLNGSAGEATFRVTGGEEDAAASVGALSVGEVSVSVPPGAHRLTLSATGPAGGQFLWGEPGFEGPGGWSPPGTPIVLVTLDTTRRDALSPYGAPAEVTPHIETFAQGATVFERAYSTTSWTLPSHASMMTGLYPSRHAAGVSEIALEGHPTLAELLGEKGYVSAGFAGGELSSARFGVGRGFDRYRDPDRFETKGDVLTGYVLDYLARPRSRPLLLFVNYFDPHATYQAPPAFERRLGVDRLREGIEGHPIWERFDRGDIAAWTEIMDGKASRDEAALAYLRGVYLAEVAFMDEQVGRLLAALEEAGLYERSLIVLVADHGELLGEGGYFSHAARLDPELTEVPLLIKWPGQRQGRRVEDLVSVTDLFPTLLAAADLHGPPGDGRLLTPEGLSGEARPYVLFEEHQSLIHPLRDSMKIAPSVYGVQRLSSHRVVWEGGQSCLERRADGWASAPCPEDGAEVLARLEALLGTPVTVEEGDRPLSEEDRKALEALGYL